MKRKQGKKGVQMTVVDERGAKSSASFIVCKNSIDEYKVRVFKSYADAIIINNENYEDILSSVNMKTDLQNFRNALLQAYRKEMTAKRIRLKLQSYSIDLYLQQILKTSKILTQTSISY